jgi:uncharacterized protein YfaT (DUF1175 family)
VRTRRDSWNLKRYNHVTQMLIRRAGLLALGVWCVVCAAGAWKISTARPRLLASLATAIQPERIRANGYDTAILTISSREATPPVVSILGNVHGAMVSEIAKDGETWRARIRSGVVPGQIIFRIESVGYQPATLSLAALPDTRDSSQDGTPDFLRLDSEHDRREFRRWFTYLAEAQFFQDPAARPKEIDDCAALIRYAYREALRAHDNDWADSARLPLIPAFDSITKYQYPFTPLRAALFRVRSGSFDASDLTGGAFLQFADAESLWRYNTHFVTRDLAHAQPGDLLFFRHGFGRHGSGRVTYHSMIFLGASQFRPDGHRYVLYHTGPTGKDPGEIRRLTVEELMTFPQSEWRPLAANPNFLGIVRWNILRRGMDDF